MTEHNPLNSSNSPNSQNSNNTPVVFSPTTGILYAPFLVWKGLKYYPEETTDDGKVLPTVVRSPQRWDKWDFDPTWRWGAFPGQVGSHSLRADVQSLGDEELSRRGIHGAAYSVAYRYSQSVFLCLVGGDVWEHDRGVRTTFMRTLGAHPPSTLGDLLVACWHIVECQRHGYDQVEGVLTGAQAVVMFIAAALDEYLGLGIEDLQDPGAILTNPHMRGLVSDVVVGSSIGVLRTQSTMLLANTIVRCSYVFHRVLEYAARFPGVEDVVIRDVLRDYQGEFRKTYKQMRPEFEAKQEPFVFSQSLIAAAGVMLKRFE